MWHTCKYFFTDIHTNTIKYVKHNFAVYVVKTRLQGFRPSFPQICVMRHDISSILAVPAVLGRLATSGGIL